MKAIHNKVNVVPVIAKADTLTLRERERLKRRVRTTESLIVLTAPVPQWNSSYHVLMLTALVVNQYTVGTFVRTELKEDLMVNLNLCFVCFIGKILDEIDEHGIKIYHLPDAESDEDEDFKEQTRILKVWTLWSLSSLNEYECLPAKDTLFCCCFTTEMQICQ